jgi:hypothetical protein
VNDAMPSSYGFRIRSSETLRFVRSGGGQEPLEIVRAAQPRQPPAVAPLSDWPVAGADPPPHATLYAVDRGFEFWVTDVGAYHIDLEAGRIEIPASEDEIQREQRLWGVPAALCYMHRGDLPLHAAAVELRSGAVLLAAPQRHGKTTLALAFHLHGYRVLSEDLACCRVGATPTMLPGPALMRIRPDVYDGQPPPGTHIITTRPDRIFLGLNDDRRGTSAPVPLRGVVFLREAVDIRMERAPAPVTLADLWALNFRLQTDEGRARSFRLLSSLISTLPAWNLYRPLKMEALEQTVARIVECFDGGQK